jgi:hypothetical protein
LQSDKGKGNEPERDRQNNTLGLKWNKWGKKKVNIMVNMERGQGAKVIIGKDIKEEVNVHKKTKNLGTTKNRVQISLASGKV